MRTGKTIRLTTVLTTLVLASTASHAGSLHPFSAQSDAARHWLILNFDDQPIGQQIAAQGNRALARIRAGLDFTAPTLPAPTPGPLASRGEATEG